MNITRTLTVAFAIVASTALYGFGQAKSPVDACKWKIDLPPVKGASMAHSEWTLPHGRVFVDCKDIPPDLSGKSETELVTILSKQLWDSAERMSPEAVLAEGKELTMAGHPGLLMVIDTDTKIHLIKAFVAKKKVYLVTAFAPTYAELPKLRTDVETFKIVE